MDDEFQANRRKLVSDRQTEIALWLLKKKKRMFRRSFKRRISRRIALNHPGEGPRNFGEGTISVRLSTYDSE
ncbi:hypothetical protein TNCV_1280881 [Trichonephila clavipes]|nr:hypothetical protein TNCV_1280881 [Trichonephila clavipes]